jgi:hypothetical protein
MADIPLLIAGIVGAVESAGAAVAAAPAALGAGVSDLVGGGTLGGILGGAADLGLSGAGLGALVGGGEALLTGGKPLVSALKGAEIGGAGGAALGGIGGGLGLVNFAGGAGAAGAGAGSPAAPIASATPAGVPLGLPGGDITAYNSLSGGADLSGPAQTAMSNQFSLDTSASGFTAPAAGTQQATFNVGADSLDSSLGGQPLGYANSAFGGTAASGTPTSVGTSGGASNVGASSLSGSQFASGYGAGDPLSSPGGAISQLTNNVGGAANKEGGSFLSSLGTAAKGGLTSLASNPGVLLAGGLVGLDALRANKKPPGETALLGEAATAQAQAAQLQSYQSTGTLPPGIQTQLQSANDAAAATIRSQYAARGMSGSSAEQQDLQALNERTVGQGAQIATQLFSQGLNEAQFSSQLYEAIMAQATQEDQGLSSAIANLSSSLALAGAVQTRKAA